MEKGKLDINTVIGFLLIGAIFLYFSYMQSPGEQAQPATPVDSSATTAPASAASQTEAATPAAATPAASTVAPDSSRTHLPKGPLAEAQTPSAETFLLENDRLALTIAAHGGAIVEARLKKFRTYDSLPLHLIDSSARIGFFLQNTGGKHTADLYFKKVEQRDGSLTLSLPLGSGELRYHYSLPDSSYLVQWQVESNQAQDYLPEQPVMQFDLLTLRHEKNLENEMRNTALEYLEKDDDDVDDINSEDYKEKELQNLGWVAYKQQFFSTILWPQSQPFGKGTLMSEASGETYRYTKNFRASLMVGQAGAPLRADYALYLGPNKYEVLKSYDQKFDELIPLGWGIFGWINRGIVISVFNWLEHSGLSYGIIILIIVLLIKTILFPLTYTSYRSMAKTRVLKPEIDELNEKYKDKDPMKKQQAVMELYSKAGVNPLGGCIPMALQMPVLIAMFHFFPASIELRQQSFLWADDLSTYDSIAQLPFSIPFYGDHVSLFTLLMTVSTIIYTYMNQQLTGQNQQYPQMKYLVYLMPVVFLGVFNNYAAGLSYYYFLSNVVTFGQQFAIRAFIDDEKIHAKLQENKKKPGKQNRLMRRMQEVQEQQNRQTRRRNK